MEAAQQLDFTQLQLEQRQKHLGYPTDMLRLLSSDSHACIFLISPWPRERLLLYNIAFAIAPMMEFQPQFMFQCAVNYL